MQEKAMKIIEPQDLVPLDLFTDHPSLKIKLIYQQPDEPNIFGVIYHPGARLWLHYDLARIVVLAARNLYAEMGYCCVVFDGLRTTDAQARMLASDIVRANKHWVEDEPRLLSPPGQGGHPRGMAVDISICTQDNHLLEMGTDFDYLSHNPSPVHNPAHRDYPHMLHEVRENRDLLTNIMVEAAEKFGTLLLPLPQEWWDFRFPPEIYNQYEPLSDKDLPEQMRMCECHGNATAQNLPDSHFKILKKRLEDEVFAHM